VNADLDCLRCGACCAPRANWRVYVEVTDEDFSRLPPKYALRVVDGELQTARRRNGVRCVALKGTLGESVCCDMHEARPNACRAFAVGSQNCLDARREVLGWQPPASA
jgi:Fe-S-cluster containining protein